MCVAVPAEVIEISDDRRTARVRVSGNTMDINIRLVSPNVGDYVLVHAGCAVEILTSQGAQEILDLYRELEALTNDDA